MKAEEKDLKDDILSEFVNDNQKKEGMSSNFTHQVMGKIYHLPVRSEKPLMSWWAWTIVSVSFAISILLAILYVPEYPAIFNG